MQLGVRRAMARLKRDFPLSRPVQVRTLERLVCGKGHRLFGTANLIGERFVITLQRHADISVQIDTLWHEWTHCLIWPRCKYRHSSRFWMTYGQIYSHYQD